jgi:DNA-binding response OmpR family regulator
MIAARLKVIRMPRWSEAPVIILSISYEALRHQLRRFLTGIGFSVREANCESDALDASESKVDLLLADAPFHDGLRSLQRALEAHPTLKVLLISAEPDYICRALLPNPLVEFIEKPFAWRELERKINELMSPQASATPSP